MAAILPRLVAGVFACAILRAVTRVRVGSGPPRHPPTPEQDPPTVLPGAEALLRDVLVTTPGVAIVVSDGRGRIALVNRSAEDLLGRAARELCGRRPADLVRVEDADSLVPMPYDTTAVLLSELARVIAGGPPGDLGDHAFVDDHGRAESLWVRVDEITPDAGGAPGHVLFAADVTDMRRGQALIEEVAVKEAEVIRRRVAVDNAKTDFIATASHELRTPLAGLLGYTELLADGEAGELNEPQAALLRRVESSARRLQDLVSDLITLARVDSQTYEVAPREVDFNATVERAIATVQSRWVRPGILLDTSLDRELPSVAGAAPDLELVVAHLVTNAFKFTPDGGRVTVTTSRAEPHCLITVADTGVGIPPSEQEDLFTPFFRSTVARERAIPGPGVGLSIVRAVVQAHHGCIEVSSHDGAGTVFSVRLPLWEPRGLRGPPRTVTVGSRPGEADPV